MRLSFLKKAGTKVKKGVSGSKKLAAGKGGAAEGPGRKIGIFGHTRSGKTVFLTMLWHATQGRRDFFLDTTDPQTRDDMHRYHEMLAAGQWPPPTAVERMYSFTAEIGTKVRYPFECQDYQGEGVALGGDMDSLTKWLEYFRTCDCLFIMLDAEDMIDRGDDSKTREERKFGPFQLMLAQLVEKASSRLTIPVAFLITKADLLEGFSDESQTQLVGDAIRFGRYSNYEDFVAAVLKQEHVARHLPWRDQVEKVLTKIRMVVDYCLTRSPDMQIFFLSSVGKLETGVDEEGRQVARLPRELKPIGLEKPFVWSVGLLMEKQRALRMRKIKWWVVSTSFVFLALFNSLNCMNDSAVKSLYAMQNDRESASIRQGAAANYSTKLWLTFFDGDFRKFAGRIADNLASKATLEEMDDAIHDTDPGAFENLEAEIDSLIDRAAEGTERDNLKSKLSTKQVAWDTAVGKKLGAALNTAQKTQFNDWLGKLRRKENRAYWEKRWSQGQTASKGLLREDALDNIFTTADGLKGKSMASIDAIANQIGDYLGRFDADDSDIGKAGDDYQKLKTINGYLDTARNDPEDAEGLKEISSMLRQVGEFGDRDLGGLLALQLDRVRSGVQEGAAAEEYEALEKEINDLAKPEERFTESLKMKLKRFATKFSGTEEGRKAKAMRRDIRSFEQNGADFKVKVAAISGKHHLRYFDPVLGRYRTDQMDKVLPFITIHWKPNQPIKFGLAETRPNEEEFKVDEEWTVGGLYALFDIYNAEGKHEFNNGVEVRVEFPDLISKLPSLGGN